MRLLPSCTNRLTYAGALMGPLAASAGVFLAVFTVLFVDPIVPSSAA